MLKKILSSAGICQRHWFYILSASRNASAATARRLEQATQIPKEIFVFGTAEERREAWKNYKARQGAPNKGQSKKVRRPPQGDAP